jgi:hypothetical protein
MRPPKNDFRAPENVANKKAPRPKPGGCIYSIVPPLRYTRQMRAMARPDRPMIGIHSAYARCRMCTCPTDDRQTILLSRC